MEHFWEIFPLIAVFIAAGYIVKISLDHVTRRMLIQKGLTEDASKYLSSPKTESLPSSSLKWGMILVALGAAVLIGRSMPEDIHGEITVSLMLLFSGAVLIIYHFIAPHMVKKSKDDQMSGLPR